jgi:hypothetical protein
MRSKSEAQMDPVSFVVRGNPRSLNAKTGVVSMNVIRPDKIEGVEADANLDAVTEVEAGIRDFVRNDVAYLRRPVPGLLGNAETPPPLEPGNEATVNSVNSLIQRVAGTSLAEIENLVSEL